MTTALIDYDPIVYSVGFAAQKTVYDAITWDERGGCASYGSFATSDKGAIEEVLFTSVFELVPRIQAEPVENALHLFKEAVLKILKNTGATNYKGFLTGSGNFRDKIATIRPYKGNRDPLHKPVHYQAIRDYAVKYWNAEIVDGMESDDAIAIEHTRWWGFMHNNSYMNDFSTIICSVDKDFNQLPGPHYNPRKEVLYWVTEEEARRNFWVQVAAGDSTDNIQGIPGLGPKKAAKLLEGCITDRDYYERVLREYNKAYPRPPQVEGAKCGAEVLQETARLVYLRRSKDDEWKEPE